MPPSFEPDRHPAPDALGARSLDSVFWLTLQNALAALLLVAIPTGLARLLGPEDLGLIEIALAFFGLATLFIELGTGPAIIRRASIDPTFLSTVFLVNLLTGTVFAAALDPARGVSGKAAAELLVSLRSDWDDMQDQFTILSAGDERNFDLPRLLTLQLSMVEKVERLTAHLVRYASVNFGT